MLAAIFLSLSPMLFSLALGQSPSTCKDEKTVTASGGGFIFKSALVRPRVVMGQCSVKYVLGDDCEAIGVQCNEVFFRDFTANCNKGKFLGLVSEGVSTKYCGDQPVDYSTRGDVTLEYITLRSPIRPLECTITCKRRKPTGGNPDCACGVAVGAPNFPWLASVQKKNGPEAYDHVCSGSLISKKWIMTAATCFQENEDPSNYKIILGNVNANATDTLKSIDRIETHPLFQDLGNFSAHNLALVRLVDGDVPASPMPICWPSGLNNSTDITTVGWGNIDMNETLSMPMEGSLTLVDQITCQGSYDNITDFAGDNLKIVCSMLCAEADGFCNADFGSPGMGDNNGTKELLGVASFTGDQDCVAVPGVFSDTYAEQYWWKGIVGFEPECTPA